MFREWLHWPMCCMKTNLPRFFLTFSLLFIFDVMKLTFFNLICTFVAALRPLFSCSEWPSEEPWCKNVGLGMSQLCFTQISIHFLSWFNRSVCTIFHHLETLVQLIWHLWSNDILKIPVLFLSVFILLSHPFSLADFNALFQKRSAIIHSRLVPGREEGLLQVRERRQLPSFGEPQSQAMDSCAHHLMVRSPLHLIQENCPEQNFQLGYSHTTVK